MKGEPEFGGPAPIRKALNTIKVHITETIDRARLLPKAALKTQDNASNARIILLRNAFRPYSSSIHVSAQIAVLAIN